MNGDQINNEMQNVKCRRIQNNAFIEIIENNLCFTNNLNLMAEMDKILHTLFSGLTIFERNIDLN